jgi:hypothetical protein
MSALTVGSGSAPTVTPALSPEAPAYVNNVQLDAR